MKQIALFLTLAAFAAAASAQTSSKSSTAGTPKTATTSASKPATAAAEPEPWLRLPPGVPHLAHGPIKIPFTLRYEEIKVGTGAEGESGKLWHIKYWGWRAADGVEFDAWDKHPMPSIKDGKPELGPDNKPIMKDPEPLQIPQGIGRVIPGFDWGLAGMRIGGKRRIFIPWQLAYGEHTIPDRPDHPGIPAKSDLIFDVELVDVSDMPQPRPMMMPPHPGASVPPNTAPHPAEPAKPAEPDAKPAVPSAAQPSAPAQQSPPPQQK